MRGRERTDAPQARIRKDGQSQQRQVQEMQLIYLLVMVGVMAGWQAHKHAQLSLDVQTVQRVGSERTEEPTPGMVERREKNSTHLHSR